jgi:hypothetical protein
MKVGDGGLADNGSKRKVSKLIETPVSVDSNSIESTGLFVADIGHQQKVSDLIGISLPDELNLIKSTASAVTGATKNPIRKRLRNTGGKGLGDEVWGERKEDVNDRGHNASSIDNAVGRRKLGPEKNCGTRIQNPERTPITHDDENNPSSYDDDNPSIQNEANYSEVTPITPDDKNNPRSTKTTTRVFTTTKIMRAARRHNNKGLDCGDSRKSVE